jgi:hypothetical protein
MAGGHGDHEHAEQASAYSGEARVSARESAERVTLGLLRAAESLERCASRCQRWRDGIAPGSEAEAMGARAQEYLDSARTYREIAARYRDIGRLLP